MLGSEDVCLRCGSQCRFIDEETMVAIAASTIGNSPVYGVRLEAAPGAVEWFLWCGEHRDDVDFYAPYHAKHLVEMLPLVVPYLALEPGFKFIVDDAGYEDVWRESDEHPSSPDVVRDEKAR